MFLPSPSKRKAEGGGGGGGGPSKAGSASPSKGFPRSKEVKKNAEIRLYVGKDKRMAIADVTWGDDQWAALGQDADDSRNWGMCPSLILLRLKFIDLAN